MAASAAELGQKTVEFSEVVRRTAEDSFLALRELVEKSKAAEDQSDSQKKIDLLKYIFKTRQRMLRLHVLAKWCQQVPLVQYCQQLAGILSSHDTCFTQAADSLFFTHEGLQQARAPVYDVPSAVEVLLTGTYRRLPKCIEDLGIQATLADDQKKPVLENLDTLLRSKLLEAHIPKDISEIKVTDGTVLLRVDGEFKVLLTLGYRGHLSLWRILHLELLIGERSGPLKLEELRRYALGDELERRMASSENPFTILYSVLHELSVALVMDTVIKQVQLLRQGRWKDAIRFELISDGEFQDGEFDSTSQKTPGLKITYWLELEKTSGGMESGLPPFIKIEPGSDLKIRCVHSGFVIDPVTEKEAEFSLDCSCIDAEGLLLRAIACKKHTRLLEIQRDIVKIPQIFQVEGDVALKCREDGVMHDSQQEFLVDEVLCVRAYGSTYITLGINIRSGRFLLQSSKNILMPSALSDCEEALNQGNMTAADVFISLRSKSTLHLFASVAKFLGFKVYETDLITLKIPRSLVDGSDLVLIEFSQCGSCYYLLLHLDRDLRPLFKLLETQPDSGGDAHAGDFKHVSRYSIIDVDRIGLVQDELNLSLLNWDKILASQPSTIGDNSKQTLILTLPSDAGSENLSTYKGGSSPSFSSLVDQVFEIERSMVQGNRAGISSSREGPQYLSNNLKGLGQSGPMHSLSYSKTSFQSGVSGLYSIDHELERLQKEGLIAETSTGTSTREIVPQEDRPLKKRAFADISTLVPSLQEFYAALGQRKRRKTMNSTIGYPSASQLPPKSQLAGHTYGSILSEANRGLASHNLYISSLLHVIRHCSLSIKHAQVTAQMDALEIPYVEEVSLHTASTSLWFRLPFPRDDSWENICLCLGKLGTMSWQVKVNDPYFKELWELQKGSSGTGWGGGVRIANASDNDSHIGFDPKGVVLSYETVEVDSVKRLVSDLRRLSNARFFARGMRSLLGIRSPDDKLEDDSEGKQQASVKGSSEQMKKAFKIEAVGLMSLWFCYEMMPITAHFVVEWEAGKEGCTMHVSPEQLWPHTKFLEDFINGGEVALFLDCIRLTAGPLLALANAIRPARMPGPGASSSSASPIIKHTITATTITPTLPAPSSAPILSSVPGRGGPGIVPSSLLPSDVAVVLRGPYYVRIIYRKKFAVDMRCFAGDQVWLQPAPPPKGGGAVGGSLPCPQFRPFIMEHVAQGLNALEPGFPPQQPLPAGGRVQRPGPGVPFRVSPVQLRGELNTAYIGLGDDGGYGGSWVPLAALKKVLRGMLKYLGVLWLFAQLPELLKEILGSIFKENEGGLLNLDQEQPALRFFVGGYFFSVSVHRVQLLLQIISVKRVHHSQQQQQQQLPSNAQEELASSEISEICDYFSRRVASEPYDTSRVSSFITLLTLPVSVLREFLKLISWEKGFFQSGELTPAQRARVELSLENHSAAAKSKSDVHHDRAHSTVDFGLTFVLDPALIPHINAAGGAAWLPYCVSVRLRYSFGENSLVSLMGMEGSHGGRACWSRMEDWEKCKLRVARAVDFSNSSSVGESQGKLRSVAESLQKSLQLLLQQLRDVAPVPNTLTS